MIAQIRAELLKLRTTRTTIGLILAMIALILLFTLLTGLLTHPSGLASREDQRAAAERGQFRRRVLRTCRGAAGDQRVPLRHDPSDDPVQPRALTRPGRQGRRRRTGRNRIRDPRRGNRLGDRLRDPRRAWHHRRARQRRHSAAHARRARRRGPVGRDRRRPRSDHPQPSRRHHHAARLGASSSTTSCSASPPRWGGSRQPVLRTHSWASESIISSRQAPARSP